ncbi:MAG TPA: molybdopterin cofactor-binding domain-containing protein, partial [Thermoplasmata archaeon]|nr:molybdopterin cofactor-binding domain-containing protein [Thermoplasmata archaeon]
MSGSSPHVPFDLQSPAERAYFERFGDGLVVVLAAQPPGPSGWGPGGPPHGGAWIHVGADGRVRAFTGKVEVGQGTRTALSLLVAEELRVPLSSVDLTMGDTDLSPWDMGTFGSRSMPDAGAHLRTTAAAARGFLLELGANRLGVPSEAVELSDGQVRALGEQEVRAVAYSDLLGGLRRREMVPAPTRPIPPSEWIRAGHPAMNMGGREIVTGARQYASDLHLPGMMYGKILFPPAPGAKLRGVDVSRARALAGAIVLQEGDWVAVAAATLPIAHAALKALRADWEIPSLPSEAGIVEYLRQHPAEGEDFWDVIHHEVGDVPAALAAAPVSLAGMYTAAYIAHVPMETHAVLAEWQEERLTVWMGTQTPFRARDALAGALGVPPSSVRVVVPPTGSGFGGKHAAELAVGAARLAKAAGHPVRIAFSREEEFTQAYLRPMAVIDVRSGAEKDGTLTAWQFTTLNAGSAAARIPYRVANQKIENQPSESPLPQGSYRALGATANNFARESHMDELAVRVGADPVEYRLRHLADERLADVLRAVAVRAGWVSRKESGTRRSGPGTGIAVGLEKGGRVATFAEVRVSEDRRLEVVRVVTG